MATFSVDFLGCKVSHADAQAVREHLLADGHEERSGPADVAVINTCCVTHEALRKSRHAASRASRSHARVYVTGCGANLSQNPSKNLAQIQNFLAAVVVLSPGTTTAEHYGRIRAQLAQVGTPIPENDIWIAALALEHQLPLAARDAHFELVIGLRVLKW